MSRWFRHYAGMMRDGKLVSVALKVSQPIERVLWVWGAILESAAEINDDGRFEFDPAEAAYFLRSDQSDIAAVVDALNSAGRLDGDRVVNWSARQFQSDRSATRQAAYRERQREKSHDGNIRQGDDVVTSALRHGDAPDTETELDTETDSEKKESVRAVAAATRPSIDEAFERFWVVYPKRGTAANPKKPARDKFERVVKAGADPEILIAAAKRFSEVERSDGRFGTEKVAQAITWLNQQRWNDYLQSVPLESTGPPAAPPGAPSDAELRAKYAKATANGRSGLDEVQEPENAGVLRDGSGAHPGEQGPVRH